jgi:hypothetical protein
VASFLDLLRLTDTGGLADIDGQISLGPARFSVRHKFQGFRRVPAYRLILTDVV